MEDEQKIAGEKEGKSGITRETIFRLIAPLVAIVVALLGGAIVIAFSGVNPLFAYGELLKGAFGTSYCISEVFVRSMPLAFSGLAFAIAVRGGLFNIGAEGQLYVGALGATLVALFLPGLPSFVLVPLSIIAAFLFGAVWGAVPAILKAKWNVNEFVNTVMMNYIGLYMVNFFVSGPLREPRVSGRPQTITFVETSWVPKIFSGTRLSYGFVILIVTAILLYILLWHTSLGYQIRVIGQNRKAASYSGMKGTRLMITTLMLAGAIAGMGGGLEATGLQHRLIANFSPGYGYTGITVSLLGRNHPLGVIVAAIFFGIIRTGCRSMESVAHVSYYVNVIIEGLILIAILSSDYLGRMISRKKEKGN